MNVYLPGADSGTLPTDQDRARSGHGPARTPEPGSSYVLPPGYVAGLAPDGSIVAVPIRQAFEAPKPVPAPAADPNPMPQLADAGLSLAVQQVVFWSCAGALAAGGAVWMVGQGLAAVAEHSDGLVAVFKTAALFVGLVVAGVVATKLKIRRATNGGDHTTVAFMHRETHVGRQRQTVIGRGSITNKY